MTANNHKWKDFLLKSSLPLEYQVMQLLKNKYGCVGYYEYTYLRRDEHDVVNEFSYDIDVSYIKGGDFFDLMIECKYRDPSTNWLFLPEQYGGIDETESYAFLNPIDQFTKNNKFRRLDFDPLGPLCSKGIEITSNSQNPKTIHQAVSQLGYAMADKVVSAMEHQIDKLIGSSEFIFYHVPIIVTTANLFRLNEDVKIDEIKKAKDIKEVCSREICVVLKNHIGPDLERYNFTKFAEFVNLRGRDELNSILKSFNEDVVFVFSVIAKEYCPEAFAVIQFTEDGKGFEKLFSFFNEVISPSEKTLERMREKQKQLDEMTTKLIQKKTDNKGVERTR